MSDSENIYSIPLDPENQSREKSSGKTKASDETEDEDIPRLEFLQEEYSQDLNIQLSHSFILFKLKCTSLFLKFDSFYQRANWIKISLRVRTQLPDSVDPFRRTLQQALQLICWAPLRRGRSERPGQ